MSPDVYTNLRFTNLRFRFPSVPMTLPSPDTPLYNHSLNAIESWLRSQGCQQDEQERNCWRVRRDTWEADIEVDVEDLVVCYHSLADSSPDVRRSFSYALQRKDLDEAIFSGP